MPLQESLLRRSRQILAQNTTRVVTDESSKNLFADLGRLYFPIFDDFRVEFYEFGCCGIGPQHGGDNPQSLLLILCVYYYPRFVYSALASPIAVVQVALSVYVLH
jgi:hypothetical protein